jgi:hypothetical protein
MVRRRFASSVLGLAVIHGAFLGTAVSASSRQQTAAVSLRIANTRLEAAAEDAPKPSTLLKFDLLNQSLERITDVVLQVVLVEKARLPEQVSARRPVVGPFTIQGHVTLEAGYTMNYVVLLRNLSVDCDCLPEVSVLSARSIAP